jgi:hypothetical protein
MSENLYAHIADPVMLFLEEKMENMNLQMSRYLYRSTVEPRSTTTSVMRPPRHDDQISPVPNGFLFNFH